MIRLLLPILLATSAAAQAPALVDTPAIAGARVPAGTRLTVAANHADQQVTSPTALAFDEQGRILVTETHRFGDAIPDDRDHLEWYLDDLAATTTADRRALHEKWSRIIPLDRMTAKSELVRRFTDSNADGTFNEVTTFADGFNDLLDGTAAGVFHYEGTTYLACIPKLLMLRDTDGDGTADERKTVAEGFGVRISLSGHDLNGFALGPDGRLYGTIGDRGFNLTTKEGKKLEFPNQGAVFRFEPDGSGFELFHTGLRNPKEIAFDDLGYPVTVDNNSDQGDKARVVFLVEGGDSGWEMEHQTMFHFHRQIGLETLPPNRWMDEKIWHLPNPDQPAFIVPPSGHLTSGPSGLTHHPGTGFLESEAGRFLITDYRGSAANSAIWSFTMKRSGAGMKLADARQLVTGIAATDVEYSWDGRLFATDFVGGWTSHNDGRLLSLDAGPATFRTRDAAGTAKLIREGFEHRSSAELANLLRHPDRRVRLRSQLALTRKNDALKRFSDALLSRDTTVRMHGIWGLGIIARRGTALLPDSEFIALPSASNQQKARAKLVALFSDNDKEIRAQALRALVDAAQPGIPAPLGPLFADPSKRVRFFAALLAGKSRDTSLYSQVCDMLAENADSDPLLRHAGAFALRHFGEENPRILTTLASHDDKSVRLAAVVALRRMKNPDLAKFTGDSDPRVSDEAIRAICDLDITTGRPAAALRLDDLSNREWTPFMLRRLLHNSFRIGDTRNAERVLKFATDSFQPEALRKEAFRLLACWTKPFPADQFTGHWRPLPERPPESIVPFLTEQLPSLIGNSDLKLTAALELAGTYQINIPELDTGALMAIATAAGKAADVRTKALDLLATRKPADFTVILTELIDEAPDEVALTALGHLAKLDPQAAVSPVATALASDRPQLAKNAWAILATIPGEKTDALFAKHLDLLRSTAGISPHAIELIEAARTRKAATVATALAALETSLAETPDPLAKWNPALQGGDPDAGKALFTSHPAAECMRCHRTEADHATGGETAPNLAGLANRKPDPRYHLESLVKPGAVIAPGFGTVSVDFNNGASLNGNLIASTPDHLDLETTGRLLRIQRADIAEVTQPLSPMPPMGELLKPAEIRDLLAFLATLTGDGTGPPPARKPEAFDPDTLTPAATADIDPAVLKTGRSQFIVCGACHGQSGEGTAAGPPLAGSDWVNGPAENLIRIQLRGLKGPIVVNGKTHNFPAGMAPLAYQSDEQIAAVLSYVRNSFGNSAPVVTPADVAAFRDEVGKPQLTAADLKPPGPVAAPDSPPSPAPDTDKYESLKPESNSGKWVALAVGIVAILSLIPVFKRKD